MSRRRGKQAPVSASVCNADGTERHSCTVSGRSVERAARKAVRSNKHADCVEVQGVRFQATQFLDHRGKMRVKADRNKGRSKGRKEQETATLFQD